MSMWEYKLVRFVEPFCETEEDAQACRDARVARWNELGAAGWELVTAQYIGGRELDVTEYTTWKRKRG